MSYYSTASAAMEHDTARRLEALDPANHDRVARRLSDIRLDHGRMIRDHAVPLATSAGDLDNRFIGAHDDVGPGAPPARNLAAHAAMLDGLAQALMAPPSIGDV